MKIELEIPDELFYSMDPVTLWVDLNLQIQNKIDLKYLKNLAQRLAGFRKSIDSCCSENIEFIVNHIFNALKELPDTFELPNGEKLSVTKNDLGFISNRKLVNYIYERDKRQCQICRTFQEPLVIDHFVSQKNGGTNHPDNLQVLCFSCNSGKVNWFDRRLSTLLELRKSLFS